MAMLLKVLCFLVLWLAAVTGVPLVLLVAFTYGLPAAGAAGLVLALVVWGGLRLVGGRRRSPEFRSTAEPGGTRDSAWKIPPPSSAAGGF
jgi:hypothetical protein